MKTTMTAEQVCETLNMRVANNTLGMYDFMRMYKHGPQYFGEYGHGELIWKNGDVVKSPSDIKKGVNTEWFSVRHEPLCTFTVRLVRWNADARTWDVLEEREIEAASVAWAIHAVNGRDVNLEREGSGIEPHWIAILKK